MKKKLSLMICVFALIASVFTACSSNKTSNPSSSPSSNPNSNPSVVESEAPYPITMVTEQSTAIPPKNNPLQVMIEEYTNTDLDIQWIPGAAYDDRINVMIASQELPKIVTVKYSPTYISHMREGLFWEIGSYIQDYPNLSDVNPLHYENIAVDGKVYGVPVFRPLSRAGVVYRQDWLDKLELEFPITVDDWYNVLKAMGKNDPDGDNKDNTYGVMLDKFLIQGPASVMNLMAVSQGAPNQWGLIEDEIVPSFVTDEYFSVLTLFRKLFSEKLINQDFPVVDDTSKGNMWDSGKLGFSIGTAGTGHSMQEKVRVSVPEAVVGIAPMQGPLGIRPPAELGNNGMLVFPKSSVKTEEDLKKVLDFLDKMLDEPMSTLLYVGIEDVHWEKEDGLAIWKDYDLGRTEVKPYRDKLPIISPGGKMINMKLEDIEILGNEITVNNLEYTIGNPALNLFSETYTNQGAELENLILDAQIKYIMSNIDEAGWQAEIEKWKKAGGSKIIEEYTAAYHSQQ